MFIVIWQINHLMKVRYTVAHWSAALCLHIDVHDETLLEEVVVGIPYLMLYALLSEIGCVNQGQLPI
jgi:hypothetical protein